VVQRKLEDIAVAAWRDGVLEEWSRDEATVLR
jgi:hypothetical protein